MKILSVVGARPNFMKIAPFIKAINNYNTANNKERPIEHMLIHTGQHYDDRMSDVFFKPLDIPRPDFNLEIGSGSHAYQVGNTMIEFEKLLLKEMPDWIVVVGDVNATLACSVTAKKLHIKVCHIEAGLRSGDMKMPEEINRLVTDRLADLLLTPDKISTENLIREGVQEENIKFVGNIMIDTLLYNREKATNLSINNIIENNILDSQTFKYPDKGFTLITMHRPSNVDDEHILKPIIQFLTRKVANDYPLIWPLHPRTKNQLAKYNLLDDLIKHEKIILLHPLGYHEMLKMNMEAQLVLTDSGGLQEECTVLKTPCITLRMNTERPVTLRKNGGASVLAGSNVENLEYEFNNIINDNIQINIPELWDGKTAERCLKSLIEF